MTYTIGEMAGILGVSASTLRYYDKEGLIPHIERTSGGVRVFNEHDYEWLKMVECLKRTGMSLRDIRRYLDLSAQGDSTIDERLELFVRQRESIIEQIEALKQTLDILEFKCWYYETAKSAGTTNILHDMTIEELPEQHRETRRRMKEIPIK